MGRIVANVSVKNLFEQEKIINFDALVDTGAAYMVLPQVWKNRLGKLNLIRQIDCETATQEIVKGEVCGPVEIKIEGFDPIYGEVLFLNVKPEDGIYEPLIGYIVLEQAQAAVDMLGHRLIHVRKADLKNID
jgi:predicted aspartyl protease